MKARKVIRFALLGFAPCVVIALDPVALSAQVPVGPEFSVNTYTTGDQSMPAVASAASGDFVVVWVSSFQTGDAYGVFGKRFGSAGESIGDEFKVNTLTEGYPRFRHRRPRRGS